MVRFNPVSVDDPRAQAALGAYFDEREATFPSVGGYRRTTPDARRFVEPDGVFLIAVDDTTDAVALGCGGVRRIEDRPAVAATAAHPGSPALVRFEVKHVWVDPAQRGAGVGGALMNELRARAERLGAEELVLDTNQSLVAAAGMYARLGYVGIPPYNDNPNATNWYSLVLVGGMGADGGGPADGDAGGPDAGTPDGRLEP